MEAHGQIRSLLRPMWSTVLVVAALLVCTSAQAGPAVIDLGNLGGGRSGVAAINDRGQAVGYSVTADQQMEAYLWQKGTMTDLGRFQGLPTGASDINNRSQVVGSAWTRSTDAFVAWIWEKGSMKQIEGLPGSDSCLADAINDTGVVAGHCRVDGQWHAFIWRDDQLTDLWGIGCPLLFAYDINARGDIVGPTETGPALCTADGFTPLCFGPGDCGNAVAINDRGQVVGTSAAGRAVLWSDGVVTDLGDLGAGHSQAYDINNKGQVVGFSGTETNDHAFVWDGVMHDLGALIDEAPEAPSIAYAINNAGDVVGIGHYGTTHFDDLDEHALLWPATGRYK